MDMRGKHNNRPNRIPNQMLEEIRAHIAGFPTYESHYVRNINNRDTLYLDPTLSVSKMYELFIEQQRANDGMECEEWIYRAAFNTNFKLRIRSPKLDCCDQCDKFQIRLRNPDLTEEERQKIQEDFHFHREQGFL